MLPSTKGNLDGLSRCAAARRKGLIIKFKGTCSSSQPPSQRLAQKNWNEALLCLPELPGLETVGQDLPALFCNNLTHFPVITRAQARWKKKLNSDQKAFLK